MVIYTQDELEDRYQDYKRGWVVGTSGKTILSLLGTPCPKHQDWFDQGYEDGFNVYNIQMKTIWNSIKLAYKTS